LNQFVTLNGSMAAPTTSTKKPFIAFAGLMGVGKTTRTELLVKHLGLTPFYEQYGDNPYLAKFYKDKKRWAFESQNWFLENKLKQMSQIQTLLDAPDTLGIIQDMSIYQDAAFAHNLYAQKFMSEEKWRAYERLLETRCQEMAQPVIFYLSADIPTVLKRIRSRGREFEKNVDAKYLEGLKKSLFYWLEKICDTVTIVEFGTEGADLADSPADQEEFVQFAKQYSGVS
jgi:deoxyadenosine/deoxycytidine kinase